MKQISQVSSVGFIITEKCNLKCSYCWYTRGILDRSHMRELSPNYIINFLKVLSQQTKIEHIELTGGEALLHKDISFLIPALSEYSHRIIIMTNALLINDRLIDLFKNFSVELHISLDSLTTNYHEEQRGNQQEIINKILLLTRRGYTHKQLNVTLSRKNIGEIPYLLQFSADNQCEIDFNLLDFDENEDQSLLYAGESELTIMFGHLEKWAKESPVKRVRLKLFKAVLLNRQFIAPSCLEARHLLVVDVNGDIRPCYKNYETVLGNIMNTPEVEDILQKHQRFNSEMKKPVECFKNKCIHHITG